MTNQTSPNAAKVSGRVLEDVSKQAAANIVAASDKVRRISRVRPIADQVLTILREGPAHVALMAEKCQCSERDIRLAIDQLRSVCGGRANLERVAGKVKTFGFRKGYKPPKDATGAK